MKKIKILIFKSTVTGAVYCWNGTDTVIIKEPHNEGTKLIRPLGKVMRNMDEEMIEEIKIAHKNNKRFFYVGAAKYKVIKKIISKL